MGSDFIKMEDLREKYDELKDLIPELKGILEDGEDINSALNTPKAIYSVSLLAAEALKKKGIVPDYVAGFSLGEITALGYTNVLNQAEASKLLVVRTDAMAEAAMKNPGSMAAVMGMETEKLRTIISRFDKVYAVNFNSPEQTVISGDSEEMKEALALIKQEKGKAISLKVSGAFHSPFMKRAEEILREHLETVEVKKPEIDLISNISARPYPALGEEIKKAVAKQVVSPVMFTDTVRYLYDNGVRVFIECGEGKVLTGLVSKTLKDESDIKLLNVSDEASLNEAVAALKGENNVQG